MIQLTEFPKTLDNCRVHFIGVKGTGMCALAELFRHRYAKITGSDVADVFYTDSILRDIHITPTLFDAANITPDLAFVVYSAAYTVENNVEMAETERLGIPALNYPQALGLFSRKPYSVGIAGVHGKTTTVGMIGTLISAVAIEATVLAGSAIPTFGGHCTISMMGGKRYFIAETCEYRRHFLNFSPSIIVLTSVESDHQDYYPTYADIRDAFIEYGLKLPRCGILIYCADDPGASEVAAAVTQARRDVRLVPYGETADPYDGFKVTINAPGDGKQHFTLNIPPPHIPVPKVKPKRGTGKPRYFEGQHANFTLSLPGKHLVLDAAAAIALVIQLKYHEKRFEDCHYRGEFDSMKRALAWYKGSKRRSEVLGEARETIFIDDYGHHPTAIRRTLEGYREFYPGRRIICDFMSHTYTRTAALLEEFADAFGAADAVLLHKIYPSAREQAIEGLDEQLVEAVKRRRPNVTYVPDHNSDEALKAAYRLIIEVSPALFITMGAGDNWKLGARLLETFKKPEVVAKC